MADKRAQPAADECPRLVKCFISANQHVPSSSFNGGKTPKGTIQAHVHVLPTTSLFEICHLARALAVVDAQRNADEEESSSSSRQDSSVVSKYLTLMRPGGRGCSLRWSVSVVYPDRSGSHVSEDQGAVDLRPGRGTEGAAGSKLVRDLKLEPGDVLSMAMLPPPQPQAQGQGQGQADRGHGQHQGQGRGGRHITVNRRPDRDGPGAGAGRDRDGRPDFSRDRRDEVNDRRVGGFGRGRDRGYGPGRGGRPGGPDRRDFKEDRRDGLQDRRDDIRRRSPPRGADRDDRDKRGRGGRSRSRSADSRGPRGRPEPRRRSSRSRDRSRSR